MIFPRLQRTSDRHRLDIDRVGLMSNRYRSHGLKICGAWSTFVITITTLYAISCNSWSRYKDSRLYFVLEKRTFMITAPHVKTCCMAFLIFRIANVTTEMIFVKHELYILWHVLSLCLNVAWRSPELRNKFFVQFMSLCLFFLSSNYVESGVQSAHK